ncbi:shikimate dehydrogenase [Candidatus Curculioniphilus buchneri]|uniref:shikimate dehydrogenase n=1 Tax=Candidatus Curculioniphilus buchneri TaxID=690594 RepID=UPI00376EAEBE
MDTFAVFGNPIEHSQSPYIHSLFSAETGIFHPYGRILAPVNDFEILLKQFFDKGGLGANITLPFKERAYLFCNQHTERSSFIGAINTIKKQPNGILLGDNTDGIGLLSDLQRLSLLRHNSHVLLVGAGGAARGVIASLLSYGCKLVLTNRNFLRAQKLVEVFYHLGNICALPLDHLMYPEYDLIINATSIGLQGNIPPILPESLITPSIGCYDMFYQKDDDTPFLSWCRRQGAYRCSDGLGMLVGQAAHSFYLWHGVLPSILSVLKTFQKEKAI